MATVYISDEILMKYAKEHEDPKEAIQDVVAENAPGGDDA